MHKLGQVKPSLTGDGTSIMPVESKLIKEDVQVKVTLNDYCGVLLLLGTVFAVGPVCSVRFYFLQFLERRFIILHTVLFLL